MAQTRIKSESEIAAIRVSGRMLATVLDVLKAKIAPGMSSKELADIAAAELKSLGGKPAFLGYYGFPDVVCVSINDEVVHGIPSASRIFKDGDIVSMDFGVLYDGMITDSAVSVIVGVPRYDKEAKLVQVTEQSLMTGIDQIRDGVKVGDIAAAVQAVLQPHGYGIVRDLVGHGVGHELHEDPNIPNYGNKGTGPALLAGMTVAIEPMATLGGHQVFMGKDGWTVLTRDGARSAHFEHTVLVTRDGYEVITQL